MPVLAARNNLLLRPWPADAPYTLLLAASPTSLASPNVLPRNSVPCPSPCLTPQGETAASWDVTSNIERSKHLDDEQQAKIYKAEVRG
jgi:hypothetical protein